MGFDAKNAKGRTQREREVWARWGQAPTPPDHEPFVTGMRGEPEGRTTRRDGARSRQASMATAMPRRPSGGTPDAAQPRFVVKKNDTHSHLASLKASKTWAER